MTIARDLSKILDANGDLNIDANTLFVDSSTNSVGIGTSSPSNPLHLSSTSYPQFAIQNSTSTYRMGVDSNFKLIFDPISSSTRNVIFQNSGTGDINVGIGTSSPSEELHIYKNTTDSVDLKLENSEGSATLKANNDSLYIDSDIHVFRSEASSEYMRIDSSGNLMVGKTAIALATVGGELRANGQITGTRSGASPLILNRTTSDGDIAEFYKDAVKVGSIGVDSSDNLYITGQSGNTGGIYMNATSVYPAYQGSGRDNYYDLGDATVRWKNLYMSGSVYLGGTGSANALDDYEEGTWTPVFTSSGGDYTITYAATGQQGRYTKIGQTVICHFLCAASATAPSGGSGTFRLGNLPFLPVTGAVIPAGHGSIGISNNLNVNIDATQLLWNLGIDATVADLMFLTDSSGITSTSNAPYTVVHNANARIDGTIIYRTNA